MEIILNQIVIAVVLLIIVLGINFLTKALAKKFDVERR